MDDLATPWFPHDNLPQCPAAIEISGGPEHFAQVRIGYSLYEGQEDLLIDFDHPEVFACLSEVAAPGVALPPDYPRLRGPKWADYLWPFMEVRNSTWLRTFEGRLPGPIEEFRHFRIVSDDGVFVVLTAYEPTANWVSKVV